MSEDEASMRCLAIVMVWAVFVVLVVLAVVL